MGLTIEKSLVISTGHIKPATNKFLQETHPEIPFRYEAHEYGYILFITEGDEDSEIKEENEFFRAHGMEELIAILFIARSNYCTTINIESNGGFINRLETFSW